MTLCLYLYDIERMSSSVRLASTPFMSAAVAHAQKLRSRLQQSAFAFMTPEERSAFASMLVQSLPFPPLPLLLLQGYEEKGSVELVSSFDLLEQAIVSHQLAKPRKARRAGSCAPSSQLWIVCART